MRQQVAYESQSRSTASTLGDIKKPCQKTACRPLLAAAEEVQRMRPLSSWRARQGQRQENDVAFVRQLTGRRRQFRRPGRIAGQLVREAMRRLAAAQSAQGDQHLLGDVSQARAHLEGFLIFRDVEAPWIIWLEGEEIGRDIGLAAEDGGGRYSE